MEYTPMSIKVDKNDIKSKEASAVLKAVGMLTPPYDPFAIAKKIGVDVNTDIDLDNLNTSGYIKAEDSKVHIWINPVDSPNRQRFTLAHELGHLVNDILTGNFTEFKDSPQTLYRKGDKSPEETAANKFAAQLLMPLNDIKKELKSISASVSGGTVKASEVVTKLARTFEVSEEAMTVRLKSIGFISE